MRRHLKVPESLDGARLDAVLAALDPHLSRRRAKALIDRGAVYLDGRRCRLASRPCRAGAAVEVEAFQSRREEILPPVEVLWEGEGIVALNKPAGVPAVPTREAVAGSLLHALARQRGVPLAALRPVHRLDAPTSGVFLVALEEGAASFLGRAFAEGEVEKTYLAVVEGSPDPPEGTWSVPLSPPREGIVSPDPAGLPALTRYRVLGPCAAGTLLEVRPATGRTHQIRVHAASAGHPIVGDRRYGQGVSGSAPRMLLHAWRTTFPLPAGGVRTVEAPVPEAFGGA
ncbi:MAG: RluA family pseudouridine synthase [Acidobacteriota bacterium]